ncbi:Nif3-like dinuclear metal center hexameric protein [Mycoplasmopsis agalactiae]|nr:Nif3-like dinuclear metal center hexameric protein [Mycoplasmopsis agalactiae]MCE6056275.1 Nif3-like dinuclear metal center hexameric protein [Mycoplasmopsis agalactiae]
MQIRKITNYLIKQYPLENKEEWDPAGWSLKFNLSEKLNGIVVALDLTSEILEKALCSNANLIIIHHPFKFYKTWEEEFVNAPYKSQILKTLKQKRINVLCLHTNYDNHKFGTSFQIAKMLELEQNLAHFENSNYPIAIKNVDFKLKELVLLINQKLNLYQMRTNIDFDESKNKIIKNIAVFSGSGSISEINKVDDTYDLIITSDIKWSDWLTYKELKIPILEISHLDEQVFIYDIYNQLSNNFRDITIKLAEIKSEPYRNL